MNLSEYEKIWGEVSETLSKYIDIEGLEQHDYTTVEARQSIVNATTKLQELIDVQPKNWQPYWLLGKIAQLNKNDEDAYRYFLRAHRTSLESGPSDVAILKEMIIQCLVMSKANDAKYYVNLAMELKPHDYTLFSNMSVIELLRHDLEEAEVWVEKTLENLPEDEPARNVKSFIEDIRAGVRKFPNSLNDL